MNLALKAKASNSGLRLQYQPNMRLQIRKAPYVLKTADSAVELDEAFRLRAKVFFEESGNPNLADYDYDEFDATCDHIVIHDERNGTLVGTYRVRSTNHHTSFYSAGEFDLARVLALPGEKMELGRAAVHPDYRNGSVISILWRGIANYALQTESNHLFGCSSVFTVDPSEAARIFVHLRKTGAVAAHAPAPPTRKYQIPGFAKHMAAAEAAYDEAAGKLADAALPTLFHAYLRMGAKICGEPALDAEFKCIDFLTLLDLEKLNRMFRRFQD